MNNKIFIGIGFVMGAAVGIFAGMRIARDKYAQMVDEEIAQAREYYKAHCEKKEEAGPLENKDVVPEKAEIYHNPDLKKVANDIIKSEGYVDEGPKDDEPEDEDEDIVEQSVEREIKIADRPVVISPSEFGEEPGFEKMEFTLYSDGVLTDDRGVIIEDPDEVVGDALDHFGEYEEDSVYVVNRGMREYYAILRDLRKYTDLPRRMRRG